MKKLFVAVVSCGVLFAACGTSSESKPQTKNGVVLSSVQTTGNGTNTGDSKSCSTGGACRVGDLTVSGGRVAFIPTADAKWGSYLEIATPEMFGLLKYPTVALGCTYKAPVTGEFLGVGPSNSSYYLRGCTEPGTAGPSIIKFNQDRVPMEQSTDWFIPSVGELRAACTGAKSIGGEFYKLQSILGATGAFGTNATGQYAGSKSVNIAAQTCSQSYQTIYNGFPLPFVPMRIEKLGSVTSTLSACSSGGVCRVGDITSTGGRVALKAPVGATWGSYLEIATPGMFGSNSYPKVKFGCNGKKFATVNEMGTGSANTALVVAGCTEAGTAGPRISSFNKDQISLGQPGDWFIPSLGDVRAICDNAKAMNGALSRLELLMTSSEMKGQNGTGSFDGSASVNIDGGTCGTTVQPIFKGYPLAFVPMRIQK